MNNYDFMGTSAGSRSASPENSEFPEDDIDLFSPRQYRLSLWYFLFDLLEKKGTSKIIVWTDRSELEFKIVNSDALARAWGKLKGKQNMTYPKFARAMRYYYRKNVIRKVIGKKYTYCFVDTDFTHDVFETFHCGKNCNKSSSPLPYVSVCNSKPKEEEAQLNQTPDDSNYDMGNSMQCQNNLNVGSYDFNARRRSSGVLAEEHIKNALAGKASLYSASIFNDNINKTYLEHVTEEDISVFKCGLDTSIKGLEDRPQFTEHSPMVRYTDIELQKISNFLQKAVPYISNMNCSWDSSNSSSHGNEMTMSDMRSFNLISNDESFSTLINNPLLYSEDMYY